MKKETTIDDLAGIVKAEFDNIRGEFDNVRTEFDNVKSEFRAGFDSVGKRLDRLEHGQEEILIKLDNKADKFEVKDFQKRMGKVEGKLGIS
jgi:hypothetical protein